MEICTSRWYNELERTRLATYSVKSMERRIGRRNHNINYTNMLL